MDSQQNDTTPDPQRSAVQYKPKLSSHKDMEGKQDNFAPTYLFFPNEKYISYQNCPDLENFQRVSGSDKGKFIEKPRIVVDEIYMIDHVEKYFFDNEQRTDKVIDELQRNIRKSETEVFSVNKMCFVTHNKKNLFVIKVDYKNKYNNQMKLMFCVSNTDDCVFDYIRFLYTDLVSIEHLFCKNNIESILEFGKFDDIITNFTSFFMAIKRVYYKEQDQDNVKIGVDLIKVMHQQGKDFHPELVTVLTDLITNNRFKYHYTTAIPPNEMRRIFMDDKIPGHQIYSKPETPLFYYHNQETECLEIIMMKILNIDYYTPEGDLISYEEYNRRYEEYKKKREIENRLKKMKKEMS